MIDIEKQLIPALVVLVFCLLYTVAIAAQTRSGVATSPEKVKSEVQRFGFGKRVHVKLADGRRARGRITGLADDQFVVTDGDGAAMRMSYSDVTSIKKQRGMPGIVRGAFVGVGYTAAAVSSLVVTVID